MKIFLKYNWPSILWAVFILYLCLTPSNNLPKIRIPYLDKMVHFSFYFILAVLMSWGWKKQRSFASLYQNPYIKIFIIASAYGIAIEVMQEFFTADRHFEWLDEAANSIGAGVGSLLAVKIFK